MTHDRGLTVSLQKKNALQLLLTFNLTIHFTLTNSFYIYEQNLIIENIVKSLAE